MKTKLKVKHPTIYVQGGLIAGAAGFKSGLRLDVIDYDTNGEPESELCKCEAGDGAHFHSCRIVDANGSW